MYTGVTNRLCFPPLEEFCLHSSLFYNSIKMQKRQKKELELLKMTEDVNKNDFKSE
jgi:hypothetical protein